MANFFTSFDRSSRSSIGLADPARGRLVNPHTAECEQYKPVFRTADGSRAARYTRAFGATVERTVVQVIEQQMRHRPPAYMSSMSDDTGAVDEDDSRSRPLATDPDIAQVQVQNKLQLRAAAAKAGPAVGIRVTKSTSSFMMVVGFIRATTA